MKKIMNSVLFIGILACAIYYTSIFRLTKNFYEVDPGKFYRSAQLTASELENVISKRGIKTVISLRGNPPSIFGEESEEQTLQRSKVEFHKYALEMDYFPSKVDLNEILGLLHNAPKPILIHCRSGSDRTGMIAALYAMEEMNLTKEDAFKQLSPKYLHFEAFHLAMDDFIRTYKGKSWALNIYDPCEYPGYVENPQTCTRKN